MRALGNHQLVLAVPYIYAFCVSVSPNQEEDGKRTGKDGKRTGGELGKFHHVVLQIIPDNVKFFFFF